MPRDNILGELGRGYKVAIETLNEGRIGIGAQMVGLSSGALDHTLAYVQERKQFGQPISAFQGVQFQLAQAATELEAARLMVYNAARLRDAGRPYLTAGAMAKLYSSQVAERVTSLAVQLFGGGRLHQGTIRWRSCTATPSSARCTKAPPTCSSRRIARQVLAGRG